MDQSIGKIVGGHPERYLWALRHHCVDAVLLTGMMTDELQIPLMDPQEYALIEAVYVDSNSRDDAAHLVYADWLEERGLESAAIAHRLFVVGFRWQLVGGHTCFLGQRIMGMCFCRPERSRLGYDFHCWIASREQVLRGETPEAAYVGSLGFRDAVTEIHSVSWLYHQLHPEPWAS